MKLSEETDDGGIRTEAEWTLHKNCDELKNDHVYTDKGFSQSHPIACLFNRVIKLLMDTPKEQEQPRYTYGILYIGQ